MWFYDTLNDLGLLLGLQAKDWTTKRGRQSSIADSLVMGMRRNLLYLRNPASLRDIRLHVADFQRSWLDLYALLLFYTDVRDRARTLQPDMQPWDVDPTWMGTFTDRDSLVLTLWEAGCPVWHIRKVDSLPADLKVGERVVMTWDPDIVTELDPDEPNAVVHTGYGGEARAYLCRPLGHLQLSNYKPVVTTESWSDYLARRPPSTSDNTSDLPDSVDFTTSISISAPSSYASTPIEFCSRRHPDFTTLADQITSRVVEQVGRSVAQTQTSRQSRSHTRSNHRKHRDSLVSLTPSNMILAISRPPTATSSRAASCRDDDREDDWSDAAHALLPPMASVWASALARVDRTATPRGSLVGSGFPFPDPVQIARVQNGDRVTRYLANWLIIRQAWVRGIATGRLHYPTLKIWREILNGLPQYITADNHEDPAYASYWEISWLLPPPYLSDEHLSKAAEKARKLRTSALEFLGDSQNEFQVLQRQVPEELHFHTHSWPTEQFRSLPEPQVHFMM